GSYLANAFGKKYVSLTLNAFDTEIDFPGTGCDSVSRAADSLKAALAPVLAGQGARAILVDTGSVVLEPGTYSTGIDQLRPHLEYNGIIYLQRSPKFHPLVWAPCQ